MNVDGRQAIDGSRIDLAPREIQNDCPISSFIPIPKQERICRDEQANRTRDAQAGVFTAAGLNGKLATHSLRKSFAQRVYEESGDIYLVQELLGHRNVSTTQKYIGVNYATAREAVEAMALDAKAASSERDRTDLLSRSFQFLGGELKGTADETLFLELALRGYDLSKLRDEKTTAEIVKLA